jgi:hypothetical protein
LHAHGGLLWTVFSGIYLSQRCFEKGLGLQGAPSLIL